MSNANLPEVAPKAALLPAWLRAMRPKQWVKNVFVFVGIFFDGAVTNVTKLTHSVLAFVIFCLVSSAIYLINDLVDIEKDRLHPAKRNRPLPSGALSPTVARVAAVLLLLIALPAAFLLQPLFGARVALYAVLTIAYSFWLKSIVILDVMSIAAGFVLRVAAGAVAAFAWRATSIVRRASSRWITCWRRRKRRRDGVCAKWALSPQP